MQQQDQLELQSGGGGGGGGANEVLHRHLDREHPRHYPPTPNVIIETTDIAGDTVAAAIDGDGDEDRTGGGGGSERLLGHRHHKQSYPHRQHGGRHHHRHDKKDDGDSAVVDLTPAAGEDDSGDEGSRKVDPAASSGSDSDSADSKSIPDLGHPHHGGGGREGNNPHSACNYIMGTGVLWPWGMTNFHFSLCVGVIGFFIFWLVLLLRIYLPDEYWVTEEEMAAEAAAEAEAEAEAEAAAAADPFAEGEAES